ncbi:MAG TPA: hypothetical protein VHT95_02380 [Vicinamibacterales bacterium]|jgi:hypothetical protein|nr:hypothetical protein [Vicinamibacterales bacterium]
MKMISVDLRAEAAAEARRLTTGREWTRDGDERALLLLEAGGAWVASPRKARLKRALGGRVCLLWRLSLEDASGRSVESRLVPVLIASVADVRRILADPDSDRVIRSHVEIESAAWREEAVRVANTFATARLAREREIAERPSHARAPSQRGLFDRRADRWRAAHAAALVAGQQAMRERVRAAEGAAAIALRPARLLLALVP